MDVFIEQPVLVISDWSMPEIRGSGPCQRICRDYQQFYAYVIPLTGNTDKEEVRDSASDNTPRISSDDSGIITF